MSGFCCKKTFACFTTGLLDNFDSPKIYAAGNFAVVFGNEAQINLHFVAAMFLRNKGSD
jgi:hypothetical protein